jgi:hypothetical protein
VFQVFGKQKVEPVVKEPTPEPEVEEDKDGRTTEVAEKSAAAVKSD